MAPIEIRLVRGRSHRILSTTRTNTRTFLHRGHRAIMQRLLRLVLTRSIGATYSLRPVANCFHLTRSLPIPCLDWQWKIFETVLLSTTSPKPWYSHRYIIRYDKSPVHLSFNENFNWLSGLLLHFKKSKRNFTSYDALLERFVFLCSGLDCKARMFVGCELYNCYLITLMQPLDFQCDFDFCFELLLWFRLVMGSNDFMFQFVFVS